MSAVFVLHIHIIHLESNEIIQKYRYVYNSECVIQYNLIAGSKGI